jgi:hypothetical protein
VEGFFETDKVRKHVEQCAVCKIAHLAPGGTDYAACCDEYAEMFENVIDFESSEGAFEGKDGALMCDECDGPVMPGEPCPACGTNYWGMIEIKTKTLRAVRDKLCPICAANLDAALRAKVETAMRDNLVDVAAAVSSIEIKPCHECDEKLAGLLAN